VVRYAAELGIAALAKPEAPGVYVAGRKLASVGIRIRRRASYHGLALNVAMDLEPFGRINPCGYAGLAMTQLAELVPVADVNAAARGIKPHLLAALGFTA
jgi:lipoyl(octanoyl) transferase